jgi:hypothetical protein
MADASSEFGSAQRYYSATSALNDRDRTRHESATTAALAKLLKEFDPKLLRSCSISREPWAK